MFTTYLFRIKHTQYFAIIITGLLTSIGCSSQTRPKETQYASVDTSKTNQWNAGNKAELWKTYHDNGQLRTEGYYKAGLKEGLHKEWEDNGILASCDSGGPDERSH